MGPDGPHVFLSHSSRDLEQAERLRADLEARGFRVWMDRHAITPGLDWRAEIFRAIRECPCMIFLLSHNSLDDSSYVKREYEIASAIARGLAFDDRFIIPVRLEPVTPRWKGMADLMWVDLFPDRGAALDRLVAAIPTGREPVSRRSLVRFVMLGAGMVLVPAYGSWLVKAFLTLGREDLTGLVVVSGMLLGAAAMLTLVAGAFAGPLVRSFRLTGRRGAFLLGAAAAVLTLVSIMALTR